MSSSRKFVLEHLLQLPAEEGVALIVREPSAWPDWLDNPMTPGPAPGVRTRLDASSRFQQRSLWVLRSSVKHHDARTRLRQRLKPWLVAVFDLAAEPAVKVVGPAATLRDILRKHKDLEARLCSGSVAVLPLRATF